MLPGTYLGAQWHITLLQVPVFSCQTQCQDIEGRNEDDESKTKIIKNQTRTQSSSLIGPDELQDSMPLERIYPAMPDRHGKEAVTRPKQNTTYHEMGRLSRVASEGEWGVSK